MGISSNQARFLALTSRQVDLEFRIQQICQRRLRLSSELENVATSYNNQISNRQLYTMNTTNSGISKFTIANINAIKDTNGNNYVLTGLSANNKLSDTVAWDNTNKEIRVSLTGNTAYYSAAQLGLDPTTVTEEQAVDAALRAGYLIIASVADEFTQTPTEVLQSTGSVLGQYELKDWRTIPALADELYGGDDVDAENKYDKIVSEINAQDKKLQLEQTSIEVEYKAVTSEKESVKKILDTNASASFKYFS